MENNFVIAEDWKLTASVFIQIEPGDEIVHLSNHVIRIFQPKDLDLESAYIVEVYSKKNTYNNIETAFYGSLEILNQFIDRVTFITFRTCQLINVYGISQFKVAVGQEFKLLIPTDLLINQSYENIKLSDFKNHLIKEEFLVALREFRLGVESNSLFNQFLHFYNVLEQIANVLSNDFRINICQHCKKETITKEKNIMAQIKRYFLNEGYSAGDAITCRKIRGKIAHGSKIKNNLFFDEVLTYLTKLERVVGNTVSKELGMDILNGIILRSSKEFLSINAVKISEANDSQNCVYTIISHEYFFNFIPNKVEDVKSHDMDWKPLHEGIPNQLNESNFKVFPYLWPY
jgi:hypothetical protein